MITALLHNARVRKTTKAKNADLNAETRATRRVPAEGVSRPLRGRRTRRVAAEPSYV